MACGVSSMQQTKCVRLASTGTSTADTLAPWEDADVLCEEWEPPQWEDGATAVGAALPLQTLPAFFDMSEIRPWEPERFRVARTIQPAPRNKGRVLEVTDRMLGGRFAVKEMPARWVGENHTQFTEQFPHETEQPWVGLGCLSLLEEASYPYTCTLEGVYRDHQALRIVTELASEGDLFGWAAACKEEPGPAREALCRPIARQVLDAVRRLHDLHVVHRDISAENILVTRNSGTDPLRIKLIDFGMSTGSRYMQGGDWGKPSYQAPELHKQGTCDGFLLDAFSAGVVLYMVSLQEYPWLSTRPGACKSGDFFRRKGLRALVEKRAPARKRAVPSDAVMQRASEPLLQLLEQLLAIDPAQRLTLGECATFEGSDRRSVWKEPWLKGTSATLA